MIEHEYFNVKAILKFFFSQHSSLSNNKNGGDIYFVFSQHAVHYFTDQDLVSNTYNEDLVNERSLSTKNYLFSEAVPNYDNLLQQAQGSFQLTQLFKSRFQKFEDHSFNVSLVDVESFLNCGSNFPKLSGNSLILRLSPFDPLCFQEGDQQRLIQTIESAHDLLILVEKTSDLMSMASWIIQHTRTVESPLSTQRTHTLPRSWHWLFLNQGPNTPRLGHWQVPNIYIQQCLNLEVFLKYHLSTVPLLQTILSLSSLGELKLNTLTLSGWKSDKLFSRIHQPLMEQKPSPHKEQKPILTEGTEEEGYILDYEEVLSGLGSESSTLQVPMNEIIPDKLEHKSHEAVKKTNLAESKPLSSISSEFPENQANDNKANALDLNSIQSLLSQAQSSLSLHFQDDHTQEPVQEANDYDKQFHTQDDFDDLDRSEVLDISLSELPISKNESDGKPTESDSFEDSSFEEVQSILKANQSLAINRAISPPETKPRSMVTLGGSNLDEAATEQTVPYEMPKIENFYSDDVSPELDFDYQTLNQVKPDTINTSAPPSPITNHYSDLSEIDSVQEPSLRMLQSNGEHQRLPDLDFDDADSLPTRVDIDTAQVLQALEDERQDTVTRVADQKEQSTTRVREKSDPISNDNETEVAPISSQTSGSSVIDREALSRENTAKLKVRDFDMLTDIKERPQSVPPPPPRAVPVSAPPLPSPPSFQQNAPFNSPVPPQQAPSSPPVSNARLSNPSSPQSNPRTPNRSHKDRRSFSDVIRSLTNKHKP